MDDLNQKHAELIAIEARLAEVGAIVALRANRGFQILLALLEAEIKRLTEQCCLIGSTQEQTAVDRAQLAMLRRWHQIVIKDMPAERDQLEQEAEGLRNHLHTWQTQYGLGVTKPTEATNP